MCFLWLMKDLTKFLKQGGVFLVLDPTVLQNETCLRMREIGKKGEERRVRVWGDMSYIRETLSLLS